MSDLLRAIRENADAIARMGHEAIAECHALGHPAWVEDRETGRIVRLDPDGTRIFEDVGRHLGDRPPTERDIFQALKVGRPRRAARVASQTDVDAPVAPSRDGDQ